MTPAEIDHVVFYEKPFLKFERLLETYLAFAPRGFRSFRMAMPLWIEREAVSARAAAARAAAIDPAIRLASQAAVRRASPEPRGRGLLSLAVRDGAVLTMDGVGEWATTSAAIGRGNELEILQGNPFPAFARAALFRLHLLHRLQGQFRRIQGDGPGALWRAEICQTDPRPPDRPEAGRLVPAQSGLFRLLHRPAP